MTAESASPASRAAEKFRSRNATIGVIGLGYVGLPLCLAGARNGFRVVGFDIDPAKPAALLSGEAYLAHLPGAELTKWVRDGVISPTTDFDRITEVDAVIICVPTPLTQHREPDLSYVEDTARAILPRLRAGQIVVLESTTWPGTTREILVPILEGSGLKAGRDFYVAFSPEREDPGNASFSASNTPKIVGGLDADSLEVAQALYESIVASVVAVSSTSTAEAVKLTENIFRSVNIALVNELKIVFDRMGIDVWEVIEAAKSKPFGYMPFYPGPGLGGHCIPIDPFYLTWKAREFEIQTKFIELAGEVNTSMPSYVVSKMTDALDEVAHKSLSTANVLVVGLAYKKNIDDIRESPALKILQMLRTRCARVAFYDPYVSEIPRTRHYAELGGMAGIEWLTSELDQFDCAVVVTDHDEIDYQLLAERVPLVIDSRNVMARKGVSGGCIVKA